MLSDPKQHESLLATLQENEISPLFLVTVSKNPSFLQDGCTLSLDGAVFHQCAGYRTSNARPCVSQLIVRNIAIGCLLFSLVLSSAFAFAFSKDVCA